MAAVLLDTTVLIDILRRRQGTVSRLVRLGRAADTPFTCAVNVEEVVRGLKAEEQELASTLFSGVRVAPLGRREGELAGNWRREYARRGRTPTQADCLVAAAAVTLGARLATANLKDFPMPDLVLEHWPTAAK